MSLPKLISVFNYEFVRFCKCINASEGLRERERETERGMNAARLYLRLMHMICAWCELHKSHHQPYLLLCLPAGKGIPSNQHLGLARDPLSQVQILKSRALLHKRMISSGISPSQQGSL